MSKPVMMVDKDGTIFYNKGTIDGFEKAFQGFAKPEDVRYFINHTGGYHARKQIEMIFLSQDKNLTLDEIIENEKQYQYQIVALEHDPRVQNVEGNLWEFLANEPVIVYEDARLAIPRFADRYTLVLSTGYRESIAQRQLQKAGFAKHFDMVLGDPKDATHVEKVLQKYGRVDAYVGDGRGDMIIARTVSMKRFGIDRKGNAQELRDAGADEVFNDLIELECYLSSSAAQGR
ncbi:HAD family hydrolase [archaeon]|nr:MAG: HAD family hydrolase [archaeon]